MATYQLNTEIEINVNELTLSADERTELARSIIENEMDAEEVCRAFGDNDSLLDHLISESDPDDILNAMDDNAAIREYAFNGLDADDLLETFDEDEEVAKALVSRCGIDNYIDPVLSDDKERVMECVLGKVTNQELVEWREDDVGLFNVLVDRMTWNEIMDQLDDKVSMIEYCYNDLGADGVVEHIDNDEELMRAILKRSELNYSRFENAAHWVLERTLARQFDAMTIQTQEREMALGIGAAMLEGVLGHVAVTALRMVRRAQALAVAAVNNPDNAANVAHRARMEQEEQAILEEAIAHAEAHKEELDKAEAKRALEKALDESWKI